MFIASVLWEREMLFMKKMPLFIIALCFFLSACSTLPGLGPESPAWEALLSASSDNAETANGLQALEAYASETHFYVSFRTGDETIYTDGSGMEKPDGHRDDSDDISTLPILPLKNFQTEPWDVEPDRLVSLDIFTREQWDEFRGLMRELLTPVDGVNGTVVDYLQREEYFLYYNQAGEFRSTLLKDKPAEFRVQKSYRFDEVVELAFPVLEDFLKAQGIRNRQVVFNTGDKGLYSFPFVYADMDEKKVFFVQLAPEGADETSRIVDGKRAQMLGHIARSHIRGALVRPLSSLHRLFFLVADTGIDAVRPTSIAELKKAPVPPLSTGPGMNLNEWEAELDKLTGSTSSKGTIRFLVDGEEYFPRLIEAILRAEDSIYVRTYIFDNDDYAIKIADILKERSKEIDVRVLLDGLGTIMATNADPEQLPMEHEAPLSVRRYMKKDSNVKIRQTTNPWLSGDHTKTTIIDNSIAFAGGMNIGREYRYEWHDLMMEVKGPIVGNLLDEFHKTWAYDGPFGGFGYIAYKLNPKHHDAEDQGYPVRALFTKAGNSQIFSSQLAAIRKAQRYIYIQNAYFSDDAILHELTKARRRGVDVRVIIPLKGNHGPMNRSNALAANAMLANGIRVFVYPGMSHVKAAVYDGWACMGSANFDKLSFRVNKEINLATSHQEAVDELLDQVFLKDMKKSVELTESFPEKWHDHLVELLADQL
jgi:cardiolipin synthase